MAIISTTLGDVDESLLDKRQGQDETCDALIDWVEYRMSGSDEIIHRSAHAHLKRGIELWGTAELKGDPH